MTFVDTNYFVRFLLDDISEQHKTAKKIFREGLEGKKRLFTSVVVFFEMYWVFTSFYEKTKPTVVKILNDVLDLSFISVENREVLENALTMFEDTTLELEDCYNICFAEAYDYKEFATFDKKVTKQIR